MRVGSFAGECWCATRQPCAAMKHYRIILRNEFEPNCLFRPHLLDFRACEKELLYPPE